MSRKNRILIIGMALTAVILTGCVSQEDYDALQAERDKLLSENESLKADVEELQAYAQELQEEIAGKEEQIAAYEEELAQKSAAIEEMSGQIASLGTQLAEAMAGQAVDKEKVMDTFEEAKSIAGNMAEVAAESINNAWEQIKEHL